MTAPPPEDRTPEPPAGEPPIADRWVDRRRFHDVAVDCGWTDAELMRFYVDGTREQLAEMLAVIRAGDAETLKRLAHGARGSSDSCGVDGLSELFRALERRADEGRLAGADRLVDRSRRRLDAIEHELDEPAVEG